MKEIKEHIVEWLKDYCDKNSQKGFVVGVSGGVDSAVTSTLCAETGLPVIVVTMPIHQAFDQHSRGATHCLSLQHRYQNLFYRDIPLSKAFDELSWWLPDDIGLDKFTMANTKSRMRMVTLYALAGHYKYLVAGTGNKIEDYGIGFFTKYGDGGVDISPIGELTKTEVWELAKYLKVSKDIIEAIPTDGLHDDNRSDETQIGATYPEMEWAMEYLDSDNPSPLGFSNLTRREKQVIEIYQRFNSQNKHKMVPIPVCLLPEDLQK